MKKIIVKIRGRHLYIDGRMCSFETMEVRETIETLGRLSLLSKEFELPNEYTYIVTENCGFAKIIKKPIEEQPRDEENGVIFFMTFSTENGKAGFRMTYEPNKATTRDYFYWLKKTIEKIKEELGANSVITSHKVTGQLNQ